MLSRVFVLTTCLACVAAPRLATAQPSPPPLLEVQTESAKHVGLPIHWGEGLGLLLEPSGRMVYVNTDQLSGHRVLPEPFAPQTAVAARNQLLAEFGPSFEATAVGPYVILAQQGTANRWRERFRTLLAGYFRYFEARGWKLRQPDFPLCVVVLPSKEEFQAYCSRETGRAMPNLLGYYFPKSNRCMLYEIAQGRGDSVDWSETERTIVHEAVHQLAYNTGVHERLASNPLWVVEGLATMLEERRVLEARGTNNDVAARLNRQQFMQLKPMLADSAGLQRRLAALMRDDDLFKSEANNAYALAWGLSFYLSERMPNQFSQYTQQMAKLPKLRDYPASDRERDFVRSLEMDPQTLSVQLQRFYSKF